MIALLTVQYLLGMYTNLFVAFPEHAAEGQLWEFAWHQVPLALHIIVGIALLVGAIVLLVWAMQKHDKQWIVSSAVAFLSILVAGAAGSQFVSKQSDMYSFLMGATFLAAILSYFWGLYKDGAR